MTAQELDLAIATIQNAQMTCTRGFVNRCWLVLFKDVSNDTYVGYDAVDPVSCVKAIKNPSYKFLSAQEMESQASAIEYAKALCVVARITPDLRKFEEVVEQESKKLRPTVA